MARLEIMGPEPDVVASARALLAVEETSGVWNPRITVGEVTVDLPGPLAELLRDVLVRARALETVGVVSLHEEITSQDVADLLGTSRPYAVGLLDAGTIPCRRLGTHRRARLSDVLAYRDARDAARRQTLDEMLHDESEHEAPLLAGEPDGTPYKT